MTWWIIGGIAAWVAVCVGVVCALRAGSDTDDRDGRTEIEEWRR